MGSKIPSKVEYNKARDKAHEEYKSIGKIFCPCLNEEVTFTSDGFRHIIYRSKGKKRHVNTQMLRFRLLNKAVQMISNSHITQEYESKETEMIVEDHNIKVSKLVKVEYFGFIGIIDGWKIKVIVMKRGNGSPTFWSVIPNWVTNRKRDLSKNFKNYSGNLEED
jgi:hypothetical protein